MNIARWRSCCEARICEYEESIDVEVVRSFEAADLPDVAKENLKVFHRLSDASCPSANETGSREVQPGPHQVPQARGLALQCDNFNGTNVVSGGAQNAQPAARYWACDSGVGIGILG